MPTVTRQIANPEEFQSIGNFVVECIGRILKKGGSAYITVSDEAPEPTRDNIDNACVHAKLMDIWKQAELSGIKACNYDFDTFKAIMISWFMHELKQMGEEIPEKYKTKSTICPVTGELISVRASTTKYSKKFIAQFKHFLDSTGIELNVVFSDPKLKQYDDFNKSSR